MYTRSPTSSLLDGRGWAKGSLDFILWGWLPSLWSCCLVIRSWSDKGSWRSENWSRWDHISREDNPRERMREFKLAVDIARVTSVTAPPRGARRSNSVSSSCTAFSATGFLLWFLGIPISRIILWRCNCWSLMRALNPGAGSVRMMAGGPSRGRNWMQRRMRASRNVWWRSSSSTSVEVWDVTHSRKTRISCRERLRTSAAKETPTGAGGSTEDCSMRARRVWLKVEQQVQLWDTRSIALSMSKAKRYRLVTNLSWWLEGWLNLMCTTVNRPSRTWRGTTIHSREGAKGSSRLTTNKPSLAIVATFKYLFTSFTLVSFFDGLVP